MIGKLRMENGNSRPLHVPASGGGHNLPLSERRNLPLERPQYFGT